MSLTKVRKIYDSLSVTQLFLDLPTKNIELHGSPSLSFQILSRSGVKDFQEFPKQHAPEYVPEKYMLLITNNL